MFSKTILHFSGFVGILSAKWMLGAAFMVVLGGMWGSCWPGVGLQMCGRWAFTSVSGVRCGPQVGVVVLGVSGLMLGGVAALGKVGVGEWKSILFCVGWCLSGVGYSKLECRWK